VDWTAIAIGPNLINNRNLLYMFRLTELRWDYKRKNTDLKGKMVDNLKVNILEVGTRVI